LWNALKLVKMWEGNGFAPAGDTAGHFAVTWLDYRLAQARAEIEKAFQEFRLSEALKTLYSLIWDDFCSWYLEWVKPGFGQPISKAIYDRTIGFFDQLLQLLHPFMPFITEEIYHLLRDRKDDLCVKPFAPVNKPTDADAGVRVTEIMKELIPKIREFRTKLGKKRDEITTVYTENPELFRADVCTPRLAVASAALSEASPGENGRSSNLEMILIGTHKFYLDPGKVDQALSGAMKSQLTAELARLNEFLNGLNKKLQNERFMQNAKPEVIDNERKKKEDTELKIKAIEESLEKMG
jgi:valyl-tRNA synthetase